MARSVVSTTFAMVADPSLPRRSNSPEPLRRRDGHRCYWGEIVARVHCVRCLRTDGPRGADLQSSLSAGDTPTLKQLPCCRRSDRNRRGELKLSARSGLRGRHQIGNRKDTFFAFEPGAFQRVLPLAGAAFSTARCDGQHVHSTHRAPPPAPDPPVTISFVLAVRRELRNSLSILWVAGRNMCSHVSGIVSDTEQDP